MSVTAPLPDRTRMPSLTGQTVVEVIYSKAGNVRGIITRDSESKYRVRTEWWDTSDWEVAHIAFWSEEHSGTFTDTVENARRLCHEHIASSGH